MPTPLVRSPGEVEDSHARPIVGKAGLWRQGYRRAEKPVAPARRHPASPMVTPCADGRDAARHGGWGSEHRSHQLAEPAGYGTEVAPRPLRSRPRPARQGHRLRQGRTGRRLPWRATLTAHRARRRPRSPGGPAGIRGRPGFLLHREPGAPWSNAAGRVPVPSHARAGDQRTGEQHEGDQHRHRIARQPDERQRPQGLPQPPQRHPAGGGGPGLIASPPGPEPPRPRASIAALT